MGKFVVLGIAILIIYLLFLRTDPAEKYNINTQGDSFETLNDDIDTNNLKL